MAALTAVVPALRQLVKSAVKIFLLRSRAEEIIEAVCFSLKGGDNVAK
jgi:hypothetical protein